MRRVISTSIVLIIVVLGMAFVQPQNNNVDTLAKKYHAQKKVQDSLQSLVNSYRTELQSNPSKGQLTAMIINLEDQIYTASGELSKIIARINEIAPESLNDIIAQSENIESTINYGKSLLENIEHISRMTKEDRVLIENSKKIETQVRGKIAEITKLYNQLIQLKARYEDSSDPDEVENIFNESNVIIENIKELDKQIATEWQPIYDKKIEHSLIAVDGLAVDRLKLEQIEEFFRGVRRAESVTKEQLTPNAALFLPQHALILKYEVTLAEKLNLQKELDSLQKQLKVVVKEYEAAVPMPNIEFEYRSLILYSDVLNSGEYDFEDVDIPELIIPQSGVYYSIRLYLLSKKATTITAFNNLTPLRVTPASNGMYQYVVGGFKTFEEAQTAMKKIRGFGYTRATAMVAWVDGKPVTPAIGKATQDRLEKDNIGRFKIEIRTENSSVVSELRSIVDRVDNSVEIMRSQEGSTIIFTIIVFEERAKAERVVQMLKNKENTDIKIIKLD